MLVAVSIIACTPHLLDDKQIEPVKVKSEIQISNNAGTTPRKIVSVQRHYTQGKETPLATTTKEQISKLFLSESDTMQAIAMAESHGNINAIGWNCIYDGKSKPCLPEDRSNAFATDCGLFQISVKGNTCPNGLFDPVVNIKSAERIYHEQGLRAWVVWKTGAYKKYLN